jgi:hypothetical protein
MASLCCSWLRLNRVTYGSEKSRASDAEAAVGMLVRLLDLHLIAT